MNRFATPTSPLRALSAARLALAAALLALLCALAVLAGRGAEASPAAAAAKPRPNFVVIQTDDQTLDELYAAYQPAGGAVLRAMPNTLKLIAGKGVTFNRYYVSYSLCCPSRVTLLTGRYAHNHDVRGNVPPEGGYPGFAKRSAFSHNIATWLQGAGYRTIHIGKFLNGYGDAPYDDGKTVPPGWSAWHTVLQRRHRPLLLRLHAQRQRLDRRPLRRLRQLGNPRIRRTRRLRLPQRAAQRQTLLTTRPTPSTGSRPKSCRGRPRPSRSTCRSTTPRPHGDFRHPAGPEPATRDYNSFDGAPLPHSPQAGIQRGQRQRQAALHPRSAAPELDRHPHLPGLLREGAGVAALGRRRREGDRRHARRRCTGSPTPTSSSPPTTASSTASTASPAASSSPTSPPPTCRS